MRSGRPRDAIEEIETVILPERQRSRITHGTVRVGKIDRGISRPGRIVSDTLHSRDQSKIDSAVLTFLTTGHSKIAGSKFVNQIWRKDVCVAQRNVAAVRHNLIAESRHESFIEIAVSVWLKCNHVCAGEAAKHGVVRTGGIVQTGRELMAVILN